MPQFNRRSFIRTASIGGTAILGTPWWSSLALGAAKSAKARSCILIFLEGGPSQFETFDPKPGTKTGGPTTGIDTAITGVQFASHLPRLAAMANHLAVLRTLNSIEGDHDRAVSLLHTGYLPTPAIQYPSLGSSVCKHHPQLPSDLPGFVSMGGMNVSAGILGPQYAPFAIEDVSNPAPELTLPEEITSERMDRRIEMLDQFNSRFSAKTQSSLPGELTQLTKRANRMRSQSVLNFYDVANEEPELFESYGGSVGEGSFARACIQARRLVESGVRFVEIQHGGWDTHANNFEEIQGLTASLDAGLAGLLADLKDRGLLDETLVVCVGEFGRTPAINGDNGRDHFPDAFSAVLAGGGVKAGQVLGSTNDDGTAIANRPISVPDFHATIFEAIGLDTQKDYFAPDGRLLRLTNNGKPITDLI